MSENIDTVNKIYQIDHKSVLLTEMITAKNITTFIIAIVIHNNAISYSLCVYWATLEQKRVKDYFRKLVYQNKVMRYF